uniref:Uncharacterized protein n=1 Tax=Panthera tigris altaica TaxID=74533 RepID=A0A8C9KMD8_PANTA
MGCKCCKMIQSYLFDPVQVPSSGYVNEVNSCKVDEGGAGKWKGKQGSQVPGHQNELQSEGLKRTASRGRAGSGQEPRWPPPGSPPLGDTVGGHCGGPGRRDSVLLPALRETHVVQSGDPRAALRAEGPALEVQDHDLQMPAPDYPPLRGSAGDTVDGEEKDGLPESHPEEGPPGRGAWLEYAPPPAGGHGLNMPFPLKRSWDSLNEAVATEALSVGFKEEDAAQAVPGVDSRNGWEDAPGSTADGSGDAVDEDAAVAEALAALEAATAGEDAEEAD